MAGGAGDIVARGRCEGQGFDVTLRSWGPELASDDGWSSSLKLVALRRGGDEVPAPSATVVVDGAVATYDRGAFAEWYRNGPAGIEQGFEIETPPVPDASGELTLVLELGGDLAPRMAADGDVSLVDESGAAHARFGALFVTDARGRMMASSLAVEGRQVRLVIEDGEAIYPLSVDPFVWVLRPKLLAFDGGVNGWFGVSVAVSGDTAIVGAIGLDAAYVYVKIGTTWTFQQKLLPLTPNESMGTSVAIEGDVAVVSSGLYNPQTGNSGAVYVFERSVGVWTQQAYFDGYSSFGFGSQVVIDNDTFVAASPSGWVGLEVFAGTAHVFRLSGSTWSEEQALTSPIPWGNEQFGINVALDGDTLVAGTSPSGGSEEAAYVFTRVGTTWTLQQKLVAPDAVPGDGFGRGVAVVGDIALVSSVLDDDLGVDSGSLYEFQRSGATWAFTQKLTGSQATTGSEFGFPLFIDGNRMLVGSGLNSLGSPSSVYLLERSGSTWVEQANWTAVDGAPGDYFGLAVGISGDTVFIGAARDDDQGPVSGSVQIREFLPVGDPCTFDTDCASVHCVDGVCCDSACGGSTSDCQACLNSLTGAPEGVCAPILANVTCRASAGVCDLEEVCDGTSTACPSNALVAQGTECRPSAGPCDPAETCSGSSTTCPGDAKASPFTTCRIAAGPCDAPDNCDGSNDACPSDAKQPTTMVCRAAVGVCDTPDHCDGANDACPVDAKEPTTTLCRAAFGLCDKPEYCAGSNDCPSDDKEPLGTPCRPAAGACDLAETCNGFSSSCPTDQLLPAATECRPAAGDCDVAEACDGVDPQCPADSVVPAATVCRASVGACDLEETCDGTQPECPPDALAPVSTECRASAGPCDAAETCSGVDVGCPDDVMAPPQTECRASEGPCDPPELCDGANPGCPDDAKSPTSNVCRAAEGPCDAEETCDGIVAACPPDEKLPAATECRPAASDCDTAEVCDGMSDSCPEDEAPLACDSQEAGCGCDTVGRAPQAPPWGGCLIAGVVGLLRRRRSPSSARMPPPASRSALNREKFDRRRCSRSRSASG